MLEKIRYAYHMTWLERAIKRSDTTGDQYDRHKKKLHDILHGKKKEF